MNRKTPEIRFEGYTDAWEEHEAEDVFVTVSDKGYTDLPVLSASQELGMVRRDQIGIDIKYDEKSTKNYKRVKPGQFVIHLRSFQGGFAWSDIDGITSPAYTILDYKNPEKQVSKFWKEVLTSPVFIKRLETVTYGIRDGRSISFTDFSTLKFKVPSVEEQTKIGILFKQLDDTITLQERKLKLLKEQKKAYLQKMFPKQGEKIPKLRFQGFTDAWEERRLDEIVKRVSASSDSDRLPKIEFEDIIAGEGRLNKDVRSKFDTRKGIMFAPESILYGKLRPYLKNWLFPDFKGVALGDFWVFEAHNSVAIFDYYLIQSERYQKVANDTSGTKMPRSDWKKVSSTQFSIPKMQEQAKIGHFFKQLDKTITLQEQQLETLQKRKKAFLQKMFV